MSVSPRYLNILSLLVAACVLAACASTDTTTQEGANTAPAAEAETSAQFEPEPEPVDVIDSPVGDAQTAQAEVMPEPIDSSSDGAQTDAADETAMFPDQQSAIEDPVEPTSDADAEIARLREELAASEAELERSLAREAEAERSRELEAELERGRALEAELERSKALEAELQRSRELEAELERSRALEAELERNRELEADAEYDRAVENELARAQALEAEQQRLREAEEELERLRAAEGEQDRIRELEAELERSRALAEQERSAAMGADSAVEPDYGADSMSGSDVDSYAEEEDDLPAYPALAQAPDIAEPGDMVDYGTEKPVEYRIYFGFNLSVLEAEYESTLAKHAEYLRANPGVMIEIQGNCDERGSREYNIALGARRALAVKRALELLGVAGNRIETVSFGSEKPVAFGHDEASWAQNRRADIIY